MGCLRPTPPPLHTVGVNPSVIAVPFFCQSILSISSSRRFLATRAPNLPLASPPSIHAQRQSATFFSFLPLFLLLLPYSSLTSSHESHPLPPSGLDSTYPFPQTFISGSSLGAAYQSTLHHLSLVSTKPFIYFSCVRSRADPLAVILSKPLISDSNLLLPSPPHIFLPLRFNCSSKTPTFDNSRQRQKEATRPT